MSMSSVEITVILTSMSCVVIAVILTQDDTIVDEEDADVESATGLELPGYQPQESPEIPSHRPKFPPEFQTDRERQITADLIADDIRRRDAMQNNCMDWYNILTSLCTKL